MFETDVLGACLPPDSDKELGHVACVLRAIGARELDIDPRAVARHIHAIDSRFRQRLDAALREGFVELIGDFLVFDRHDSRQDLDDDDVRAEAMEHGGELDADGAGADDAYALRLRRQREHLGVGHDRLTVHRDAWYGARLGAGRHDNVAGGDGLRALFRLDFQFPHSRDPPDACERLDVVLTEEVRDAAGVFLDDPVLPLHQRRPIEPKSLHDDALLARPSQPIQKLRRIEEDFAGNAPDMKACTAEMRVFLDH